MSPKKLRIVRFRPNSRAGSFLVSGNVFLTRLSLTLPVIVDFLKACMRKKLSNINTRKIEGSDTAKQNSRWLMRFVISLYGASVCVESVNAQIPSTSQFAQSCIVTGEEPFSQQVWIEGGQFVMGDDSTYAEEAPAHGVVVSSFWIDVHEVTNAQFGRFVEETGYVTVAERIPFIETSTATEIPLAMRQPGSIVFSPPDEGQSLHYWWSWVPGAHWRQPEGPDSNIEGKENFPVVHIAYEDAVAYAEWAGRSLPTEAQFELVARNRRNSRFAWHHDGPGPRGHYRANTWQGEFPLEDTAEDGHRGLAPVGCYPANDYGVYDMIGNVWEWTSNWYFPGHRLIEPSDPQGPELHESFSPDHPGTPVKVIKGGSYLCAESYCLRFRPAARQAQETGLGTSHIGFRTVLNEALESFRK